MVKSLYFKIVLILLIFIIAVMCAVSAILMNGVMSFYTAEFSRQMEESFSEDGLLMPELQSAASGENYALEMKNVLSSYGSLFGVDQYRNYYILGTDGEMLSGSDAELGRELAVTPNLLSAMSGRGENTTGGMDYADWAFTMAAGEGQVIVYVKDSMEEMRQLNDTLFEIILQAMLIGVLIAVLLSFFLAKSISSPLQSLTYGTQLVSSGDFSHEIEVRSEDEIGVLAENFNHMREQLRSTLEEVDGERKKLDTVLSCVKDAVLAFTAGGEVLLSNSAADRLFREEKLTNKMTLDRTLELLDIPLSVSGGRLALTSPEAEAEATHDGYIFHDRIFRSRVYDVSFATLKYHTGKKISVGSVIMIHDVTGRYELDESRREFVANVSHELRTPLTSIKGATETVRMSPDMDEATRDYFLDMVLSESDRMTSIVSDLLILSRLDNKRTKWNPEAFDMRQSVRRLIEVMRPNLEAHRHSISLGCDREMPDITADRQRIEQVVINILTNAIKYTPDGGVIDVKVTQASKNMLSVKVTDNGIGIPEEDIGHLFERFYRVEKSRNQDAGGTGLGLAIAKEIVEAHGGNISVQSVVGKGTAVTVELPFECKLPTDEK